MVKAHSKLSNSLGRVSIGSTGDGQWLLGRIKLFVRFRKLERVLLINLTQDTTFWGFCSMKCQHSEYYWSRSQEKVPDSSQVLTDCKFFGWQTLVDKIKVQTPWPWSSPCPSESSSGRGRTFLPKPPPSSAPPTSTTAPSSLVSRTVPERCRKLRPHGRGWGGSTSTRAGTSCSSTGCRETWRRSWSSSAGRRNWGLNKISNSF